MLGGEINDPMIEKTLFSSIPPSNSLVSVSRAELESQGHRQVWRDRIPGLVTADADLDCSFVKNALVYFYP